MQEYLVQVAVLIDTARMQELWMRVDLRGFCIGAAYGPLLLIHSVITSCEYWAGFGGIRPPAPAKLVGASMSDNEQSYEQKQRLTH